MRPQIAVILIIASMLVAGISFAAPKATTSEYLKTTGGGISISGGSKPLFYSMILSVKKDPDTTFFVKALFERPGDPENPLVTESKLSPGDTSLFLDSPQFQGIENGKVYSVEVFLYTDKKHKKEVSKHAQDVHFEVPEKLFEKLGLERP